MCYRLMGIYAKQKPLFKGSSSFARIVWSSSAVTKYTGEE